MPIDPQAEVFAEAKVDIVLTDVSMPKKCGLTVLKETKEISNDCEIILMTGCGDELIAIVEQVPAKTKEMAKLEAHRKYIDIQLVLEGDETMGWKPLTDCLNPVSDHSEERDIRFFHDAPASYVPVPPDHFCIFFPEDAHAPLVGTGTVRKVIFKVAVKPV